MYQQLWLLGKEGQFSLKSGHWWVDHTLAHAHIPKSLYAGTKWTLMDFLKICVYFHMYLLGMSLSLGRDWLSGHPEFDGCPVSLQAS